MKAVYINSFGNNFDLSVREVDRPTVPTGSQILVCVKAAGLNRADLLQTRGLYPPPPGFSPNMPGLEFAGIVEEIGEGVTNWKIGARVFGITAGEAQAEFLTTDADHVARIPGEIDFNQAAAVPEAFITAHDAISTQGQLAQGETLLIHAVGSGVGLAALQLAKAKDVFVIGTSRTAEKLEKCQSFGLDLGIEITDGIDFAAQIQAATDGGADVILDLVGAGYFEENLKSIALKGRLVLVGLISGRTAEFNMGLALQKRARIIGTVLRSRSSDEKALATKLFTDEVLPLLQSGVVKPNLDRACVVDEVVEAYKYLASNESFGKVVLAF